jgi:hypothetical protein
MRDELDEEGIPSLHDAVTSDGSEEMPPPRDHPQGAAGFGTTVAEERRGESLAQRVRREEPDVLPGQTGETGPLLDPADEDVDDVDDESAMVATDTDSDQALSAEEAAVHVVDEP